MRHPLCLGLALFSLALPGFVRANTQDQTSIAFHAQAHSTKTITICGANNPNTQGLACADFVTQWPIGSGADVYLVVAHADYDAGIAGMSCGIAYNSNVRVFGWELCADLDFANGAWPASGGGNRITWSPLTNCQRYSPTPAIPFSVQAVAGAFYVYAYGDGFMHITPNNGLVIPELKVADCDAVESYVNGLLHIWDATGFMGFGSYPGHGVCQSVTPPVPVERVTWGHIKSGS